VPALRHPRPGRPRSRARGHVSTSSLLVVPLAVGSVVTGVLAVPAAAAGSTARTSVTFQLAAADQASLDQLAHAHSLGRGQRLATLRSATPSTATRDSVEDTATAAGLTVTATTDYTVTATGSPAAVATLVGTSTGTVTSPAAFDGRVTSATAGSAGAGQLRPLTAVTGARVRSAYQAPAGTPTSTTAAPTIATLQFSGWNSSDLSSFAVRNGLADPVASGQYTAVSVDGANPAAPTGGGEVEVALDQEALLTTDPSANQRAYFAPNTDRGEIDALNQVASAAAASGSHLTTLSISWGDCEQDYTASKLAAVHTAMSHVLAAGVTVFAASGDAGGFDCGGSTTPTVGVDYPAADPLVVGVGGTTLSTSNVETAWWSSSQGAGGGGGYSTVYARPSYQAKLSKQSGRAVPDIALVANPADGLVITADGQQDLAGGTSLSGPLAAATFTDLLTSSGVDTGVGDIHQALYAAPAKDFRDITSGSNGVYRATAGFDPVTGRGAPLWSSLRSSLFAVPTVSTPTYSHSRRIAVSVTAPTSTATVSYAAGTGTAPSSCSSLSMSTSKPTHVTAKADGRVRVWVASLAYGHCSVQSHVVRVDTAKPRVTVARSVSGSSVRFRWTFHDASPSSGLKRFAVVIRHAGHVVWTRSATTLTSRVIHGAAGQTYTIQVTTKDKAGNSSHRTHALARIA
jgi:hypothetical protein